MKAPLTVQQIAAQISALTSSERQQVVAEASRHFTQNERRAVESLKTSGKKLTIAALAAVDELTRDRSAMSLEADRTA